MDWFRVNIGLPRHPKVGRLARRLGVSRVEALGLVVGLWSWVAETWDEEPYLGEVESWQIAEAIGWRGNEDALLPALLEAGFLEEAPGGGYAVHGWEAYQSKDSNAREAARLRKQRERARLASGDGIKPNVTPERDSMSRDSVTQKRDMSRSMSRSEGTTDVRTNVRTDQEKNHASSLRSEAVDEAAPAGAVSGQASRGPTLPSPSSSETATANSKRRRQPVPPHTRLLDLWRQHCAHLPQVVRWTKKRQDAWSVRCREDGFTEHLEEVVRRIGRSSFCAGDNDRHWQATVDWLLMRQDAWVRVLEGRYDDRDAGERKDDQEAAKLRKRIARLERAIEQTDMPTLQAQLQDEIEVLRQQLSAAEE